MGARRLILVLAVVACAGPSKRVIPPEAPPEEKEPVVEMTKPEEPTPPAATTPLADQYREVSGRIIAAALEKGLAYERLGYLCDVIGPRLSGSRGLERAVDWTAAMFEADGVDVVRKQPVKVPKWVRGEERLDLISPRAWRLGMIGLGNSVGTPEGGITADVVVVTDFEHLASLGEAVSGKIVLYNHPMPPYDPVKGARYGPTVTYRTNGASRAAEHGAVAVLVRSVTATSLYTAHTGMLRYDRNKPKIPAAAVTIEDTELMARLVARGETVRVKLSMEARFEEDADSANVIGELRGRETPDEFVVIGGHLDSWDVGQGAHDDGGPAMACMDVLRLLRTLDLRPRRSIRVVLFTNEENGLRGARAFVADYAKEMKNCVAAIEADSGAFQPVGFRSPKPKDDRMRRARAQLEDIVTLLDPIGAGRLREGGGGADVGPMQAFGVPVLGLDVEGSRYFDYHHTHADTFDKIDRKEILSCEAAMAVMAYVLADMPQRLGSE